MGAAGRQWRHVMTPRFRVIALVALIAGIIGAAPLAPDPFLWLESVNGARAMAWVKAENAKTLAVLQRDPHFAPFRATALALTQSQTRIPVPEVIDGNVYNFWQDATHVRGIWRMTTIAGYAQHAPPWKTVLDLDALAAAEGKNWVWQGDDCESPSGTRCLISLSDGGEDASTIREFDLTSGTFVDGGFVLPRAKQTAVWVDDDTLLVARPWEPTDVTASGYSYIVKTLKRGEALADAVELARGTKSDVDTSPVELHDGQGHRMLAVRRAVTFFESRTSIVTPSGLRPLDLPPKNRLRALVAGRLLISLEQPWRVGSRTMPSGDLVSVDLAAATADPAHLEPSVVYAPGPRESFEDAGRTRDRLIVTSYANVRGRVAMYAPLPNGGWSKRALPVPDYSTVQLTGTNDRGSTAYVAVTSFLAADDAFAARYRKRHVARREGTAGALRRLARRRRTKRSDVEGRHAHPLLHRASEEPRL